MKKISLLACVLVVWLAACSSGDVTPVETETVQDVQPTELNETELDAAAGQATESGEDEVEEEIMEAGYQVREILIEKDGLSIFGQAYIPGDGVGQYPTVIIGHGFSGSYQNNVHYAEYLASNGIVAYVFDFIGGSNTSRSGGDTREMSVLTEVEDMTAVFEYFKTLDFVDTEQLFLMGESQGGFVAALVADEYKDEVAGLILLYPAFVIPEHGKAAYGSLADVPDEVNLWGVNLGAKYYADIWDMDVYQEISAYTGDVLIFHGTRDTLVELASSEKAVDAYQSAELVVYEDVGHGFYGPEVQDVNVKLLAFIRDRAEITSVAKPLIPEFSYLPSEYNQSIDNGGSIERVDYTTEYNGQTYDKHAFVYLPFEYDASGDTSYDIFYLMHGGSGRAETFFGGEGRSTSLKNILDHMIENGEIEPLIVVTPSYYNPGSSDDGALVRDFQEELFNELMPVVEVQYHTYAQTIDEAGFQNSREHRAFGGFSMGSVTTWYTFIYHLDYFKYFMPMSADSWVLGMMGGANRPDETAAYLSNVVAESGYGLNDFFILAANGTNDMAYEAETAQIEAMKTYTDAFIFCNDLDACNLYYIVAEGGQHSYEYMNEYIYNALPHFFE